MGWSQRAWHNKILYLVYRVLMCTNSAFYYYFAPFVFFLFFQHYLIDQNIKLTLVGDSAGTGEE